MKIKIKEALEALKNSDLPINKDAYTIVEVQMSSGLSSPEEQLRWNLYVESQSGETLWSGAEDTFEEALEALRENLKGTVKGKFVEN
jgi:hypothetical protein